jgi:hypothetical protein
VLSGPKRDATRSSATSASWRHGREAPSRPPAERNGEVIDTDGVNVFHLRQGQVDEVREFSHNTAEADAFWA